MILYRELGGIDDTFKWNTSMQGDIKFYAFFDGADDKSASPGADKYQNGAFFLLKDSFWDWSGIRSIYMLLVAVQKSAFQK